MSSEDEANKMQIDGGKVFATQELLDITAFNASVMAGSIFRRAGTRTPKWDKYDDHPSDNSSASLSLLGE